MQHKAITFDMVIRWLIALAALGCAVWLADVLKNVLLPFVVACLVAYMLEPIVEFQQEELRLKHRAIPVFLTLIELGLVIGAIAYFFVPMIMNEIEQLEKMVKASGFKQIDTSFLPPAISEYIQQFLSVESLTEYLKSSKLMTVINKSTPVLSATAEFFAPHFGMADCHSVCDLHTSRLQPPDAGFGLPCRPNTGARRIRYSTTSRTA